MVGILKSSGREGLTPQTLKNNFFKSKNAPTYTKMPLLWWPFGSRLYWLHSHK
jgi:hypothetical protein